MKPRVAFLGLGTMGGGMAMRLLEAGYPLTVWNRSRPRTDAFAQKGAKVAKTPGEAAENADFIMSMVADDAASREVWLGENGALRSAKKGAIFIESSTVSPGWVRELSQAAARRGCAAIDAPVTGSKTHAASGQVLFLVGGEEAVLERARDVLQPMSKGVLHVGPVGSGALLKLVNNFVCGVQAASLAEAVALIERSGLDRERTLNVLLEGAPGSPLVKTLAARMTERNYDVHFTLVLMQKDLSYAIAEGQHHSVPLETAGAALRCFERACAEGHGMKDLSAVVEPLRNG